MMMFIMEVNKLKGLGNNKKIVFVKTVLKWLETDRIFSSVSLQVYNIPS